MNRVELYAAIRPYARSGMSNRAMQRKYRVGFRTVAAALEPAWPKPRQAQPKRGSRLDDYKAAIDDWLRSDLDAPRKQRHTAKRIFDRRLDEYHATDVWIWPLVVDGFMVVSTINAVVLSERIPELPGTQRSP